MIKDLIVELKKLGIDAVVESSDTISLSTKDYNIKYVEEERECLAFLTSVEKQNLYGQLLFTVNGENKPKMKYALKDVKVLSPKDVAKWIVRKMKKPERDPESMEKLKEFKTRLEKLGLTWIEQGRSVNISPEFEEYEKIRIDSLVMNYNDIITDDHMLIQIKTLLDQPGKPRLYLFKTVTISDTISVTEEEFEESNLETLIKRTIMYRYLELGDKATGNDEKRIRDRVEAL